MGRIRQLLFPLWYVAVRLGARPGRVGLVVVGIAGAAALSAGVLAGSLVAEDRALARALDRVPPPERGLRAAWFGAPRQGGDFASLDRSVEQAFAGLGAKTAVRAMQFRQTRVAGKLIDLGAVDGLASWVRLRSGRLPGPCRSERCEVLQLAGSGAIPNVPGLRLVLVGRATLTSQVPFGRLAPSGPLVETVGARFAAEATQPPFLVAEGVAGLSRAPELASIYRGYAWFAPLERGAVRPWDVDTHEAAVARARSRLKAASFLFDLTAPVETLEAAAEAGRASARRLLLVGGEAAVLVLAFSILAAAGLRRDHDADLRRMAWYGAGSWQLALRSVGEAAFLALGATILGWALGSGVGVALAEDAGSPRGIARHSVFSAAGIAWAFVLAGAAALVLLAALRLRAVRVGPLSLSVVDVAALGAVAAVAAGLARGEADATGLAQERGTGAFLLLLPALLAFAFAVVLVRVAAPLFRLVERLGRRSTSALRVASLSLARNPGRPAVAASFLAVSLGLAAFAATYRATLERGQVDQARFRVPLDLTLRREPGSLHTPLDLAPLTRYERLTGGGAMPIVRLSGGVSRLATRRGVTILGIPASELARLPDWRDDFAALPPDELATRIGSLGPAKLRGPRIPADARELLLRVRTRGDDIALVASIATASGPFLHLDLGETDGSKPTLLSARLPAAARGGRVVALTLGLTALSRETGEPLEGALALGELEARRAAATRAVVTAYRGWIGVSGVERTGGGRETTLRYFVTNQVNSRFRPQQVTDGRRLPVIASPPVAGAAGPNGVLPIQRVGEQLTVRVVAVARRFPSIDGDFVVADADALATSLNADTPGSGRPDELWLRASPRRAGTVEAALGKPPFQALEVESRFALEGSLRRDPLARATVATLAVAALLGITLALIGALLVVTADLKDERGELFDLEAQGAEPSMLRRHVHLRAALTTAIGLLGGIVLGAILLATVVDLVQLTASARLPEPPLLLRIDWRLAAAAVGGYLATTALLVGTLTWNAFRSPSPARASAGSA